MKYNNAMDFKRTLTILRERANLTKTALSKKVGVTPFYIMQIESGNKKPPPLDKCDLIAKALNLNADEKKEFIELAVKERAKDETIEWLETREELVYKIPVISWVHANSFKEIEDHFEPGMCDEWVNTTTKGDHLFALRVKNDCMEPEFADGDIIIINQQTDVHHGDFIIVRDSKAQTATFKQYFRKGKKVFLHPLNKKYEDIELDHDHRFEIIGKVIEKIKKYK